MRAVTEPYALTPFALAVLLVGCGGPSASPTAPTVITVPIVTGPSALPPSPAWPHFALELSAASSGPVRAGDAWHGLVTITPSMAVIRPELPALVSTTCGPAIANHPGVTSGSIPFSCLFSEGVHQVTARAQMADGQIYLTGMAVSVLPAPEPPPPPAPLPPPDPPRQPAPSVDLRFMELDKSADTARWRFYVVVNHGEFEDADFDFGPGSSCGGSGCNRIDDEDDYIDVKYTIAGTKEVRVAVTVDGNTIRARRVISVAFASPAVTP